MSVAAPAFETFEQHYQAGKTQLIWHWVNADLETPVSAYLKLCNDRRYAFLLESVEGGATLGRYSIIGYNPDFKLRYDGKAVDMFVDDEWKTQPEEPLQAIKTAMKACHIDVLDNDLPPMAASGLFGYLGYDMIRLIEDIPNENPDDLHIPESMLIRPTVLVIFDNVKNQMCLVTPIYEHARNSDKGAEDIYSAAQDKIKTAFDRLQAPLQAEKSKTSLSLPLELASNMEKDDYKEAVSKAVEYIHAGEIFQTVLSQRYVVDFDLPAFDLYRSLRRLNPSPFLFHVNFDDFALVGSSPEILVRVRDDVVTIRPIAGTRPRGKSPEEDRVLGEELLEDPKECAEHLMLLDLGRNDVGRVAEIGSVNVTDQFTIERYSHVMHIVSNVEGKLRKDMDSVDALFAGFPAGTVSGAPKVRAMEIIDELEVSQRKHYAGGVGYLSGHNEMDVCIALRTALVKDGKVYVQSGAGIVADSDPESEYQETLNKARALIQAAEKAIENATS